MNFDMFYNKQNEDLDPNYIYPRPYIDPTMYVNPYYTNGMPGMNQNMNMGYYMTYMNPYMANPMLGQSNMDGYDDFDYDFDEDPNSVYAMNTNMNNMMPGMMPQNMMPGMMMPGMMFPGMMQGMMMPGMPMYPFMQMAPGMPPVNMEEFDEEEM